jgi:hypothetical protein
VGLSAQWDTTMTGFMAIPLRQKNNTATTTMMASTIKSILEIRQKN